MAQKNKLEEQKRGGPLGSSTSSASSGGALTDWFTGHISRRSLGKGMVWAAVLGMAGVTVYKFSTAGGKEVAQDSLDLQKEAGWNVGSTDKNLVFTEGLTAADSRQKTWSGYDPNYLISIYQPRSAQWQPFFVPTLLQSLSQPSLSSQVQPMNTAAMREAYRRAQGLENLLSQAGNANQTLLIADLPGPESVAVGAALSDVAQVVPIFDNWPHPLGVVHSHETLAAMVYYAHEIEEQKAKLKDQAPAVILLDSNRLAPYSDQDSQFDNRYLAKLPPTDQLKQRGIQRVIYVVGNESQREELDDINDDLVEYEKNGIQVQMLRLSEFKPYNQPVDAAQVARGSAVPPTVNYYYGGSPFTHWWFYNHYYYSPPREIVIVRDGYRTNIPRPNSPPPYQPPTYRPVSRPTIFSSSRVGATSGTTGVGKARPSGFGRTSVRRSNDGQVVGTRFGRSGSFGRSGGGWFGG
ncbi:MAG TPA: hypothetical protein VJ302_06965 [Blastocatellia bacterium]|nr:hypothetical protein [Blastocatellia bacterium]